MSHGSSSTGGRDCAATDRLAIEQERKVSSSVVRFFAAEARAVLEQDARPACFTRRSRLPFCNEVAFHVTSCVFDREAKIIQRIFCFSLRASEALIPLNSQHYRSGRPAGRDGPCHAHCRLWRMHSPIKQQTGGDAISPRHAVRSEDSRRWH